MRKLTKEEFIAKSREVHGDKYDYSRVEYKGNKIKVCIICKKHGEFWQTPYAHMKGQGCPHCVGKAKKDTNSFTVKAVEIHGNKYDYSNVKYINNSTKVCIICKNCNRPFWQIPNAHLRGKGCPYCYGNAKKCTQSFTEEAIKIHGDRYDYSKVNYINNHTKVCIICPTHGEFWQTPVCHLSRKEGCPHCKSSKGESQIEYYLKQNNIEYISQYKVNLQESMIFSRNNLKIDFYLPKFNMFIEFHGIQHYEYISFFHRTKENFQIQLDRDKRVREYCKSRKIKLVEIKYTDIDNIERVLSKKLKTNNGSNNR